MTLDVLDIVFHLATIGPTKTDDPSHRTTIHKGHVAQDLDLRCECNCAQLAVFDTFIDPNQRSFPIKITCQGQGNAVLCLICCILGWIKLDSQALL